MQFGFYPNPFKQATRMAATMTLMAGLSLILLGILIILMPQLIAYFIAGLLMVAGISVVGYALRLFVMSGFGSGDSGQNAARRNVRIRIEDRDDNSL
ncbi:MAG: hypothetical protein GX455_06665 [Phycisphaerae bacterium]|nr:hypothetical protein [Phycisphaerae bacterium]